MVDAAKAFSSLAVDDTAAARKFYGETLVSCALDRSDKSGLWGMA